jgi:hypothetical protein
MAVIKYTLSKKAMAALRAAIAFLERVGTKLGTI